MGTVSKFAGVFEARRRLDEEARPPDEPVQEANPSTEQTRPSLEPVAVADVSARPERTGTPDEPARLTDGYTAITNHVLDDILPTLEPHDQSVLVRLYRLTRGHRNARCKVTRKKLIAKTGVKKTRLLQALVTLEDRGYIKRLPDDVESADIYDRGMNIEMLLSGAEQGRSANPSATRTRPPDEPNKYKDQKKDSKRRLAREEIEQKAKDLHAQIIAGQSEDDVLRGLAKTIHAADVSAIKGLLKFQ